MAQLQLTGVTGSLTVYGIISGSSTISGSNINASGNITAATFTGNGSGLTNVAASSVANALTAGTGLSFTGGGTYNGSTAKTINLTTPVARANGGFGQDISAVGNVGPSLLYVNSSHQWAATSNTAKGIISQDALGITVFSQAGKIVYIDADGNTAASSIQENATSNVAVGGVPEIAYKLKIHGDLGVTGTVYETSTIKVKENIETLTDEISKLIKTRPVEFDYIENGVHSYGFIAQELNELYPDAVIKDENNEPIGVAYADLTSPIIRGIQQLHEKIVQLEERIKILELEKGA